ncbi:hypothetical protein FH972_016126 [Carpinus fangiana]|uniref:Uncharacterized protein n=1 Tax=Carpinus fangiana TaxID=176857 RepID=A0A5N6RIF9_9ROSI|nr:hypothetical protein FH972_016126 [Carpinus fangiana]
MHVGDLTSAPTLLTDPAVGLRQRRFGSSQLPKMASEFRQTLVADFSKHWWQISANSGGGCGLAGSGGRLWWKVDCQKVLIHVNLSDEIVTPFNPIVTPFIFEVDVRGNLLSKQGPLFEQIVREMQPSSLMHLIAREAL